MCIDPSKIGSWKKEMVMEAGRLHVRNSHGWRTLLRFVFIFFACVCISNSCLAATWNTSDDWHCNSSYNPDNDWSYGYKTTAAGALILYNWATCGGGSYPDYSYWTTYSPWATGGYVHKNMSSTQVFDPGWDIIWNPQETTAIGNSTGMATYRWTAPSSGAYQVDATFTGNGTNGTTSDVYVFCQGDIIFEGYIAGYRGDSNNSAFGDFQEVFSDTIYFNSGDFIDFVVGDGGDGASYDLTGVDVTITDSTVDRDDLSNLSGDWHCNASTNPDNNWAYGYKATTSGTFNLHDWATCGGGSYPDYSYWTTSSPWATGGYVQKNKASTIFSPSGWDSIWFPHETTVHASNSAMAGVQWIAPEYGAYTISADFTGNNFTGTTSDVHVVHNNTELFRGNISGYRGDSSTSSGIYEHSYSTTLILDADDTFEFLGDNGGNADGKDLVGTHVDCKRVDGDTWDSSDDWHCNSSYNPDNDWTYGYKTSSTGTLTAYNWATCGGGSYPDYSYWTTSSPWGTGGYVHKNMNSTQVFANWNLVWNPLETTAAPSDNEMAVMRWTATDNGDYCVRVDFTGNGINGTTANVYVVINDEIIFQETIDGYRGDSSNPADGTYLQKYDDVVTVKDGETIDLVVDDGGDGNSDDLVGIKATIVKVPEQAAMLKAQEWIYDKFTGPSPQPPFSFTYGSTTYYGNMTGWTLSRTQEKLDANRTLWTLRYSKTGENLIVICEAIVYNDFPAVEWLLRFFNQNTTYPNYTYVLSNIQTGNFNLSKPSTVSDDFTLYYAKGAVGTASLDYTHNFEPISTSVASTPVTIQNTHINGRSSSNYMPYFNLANPAGNGNMVAVGWSGQWKSIFTRGSSLVNVQVGMATAQFKLFAQEYVRMPGVLLTFWSGSDRMDGHNQFRQLMLTHYSPKSDGIRANYPVTTNPHGVYGYTDPALTATFCINNINDIDNNNLYQIDTYAFDAGWYRAGSYSGTEWEKVGDWNPDTTRFPGGTMKPIADKAHATGRKFLLWFEPERVHSASSYWNTASSNGWLLGSNTTQKLLDFGNSSAWTDMYNKISTRITNWDIDIYRHDFNLADAANCWSYNESWDRLGIHEIKHIMGLYAFFDELLDDHPGLIIDNSAGGGQRLDFEMMRRSICTWRSDILYSNFDAVQCHTYGVSYWLPTMGYAVNQAHEYNLRSGIGFGFGFSPNYYEAGFSWTGSSTLLSELKQVEPCFIGDYYPLTSYSTADTVWQAWQFNRPDMDEGIVQAFRRQQNGESSKNIKLVGLDANATYHVWNLPGYNQTSTINENRSGQYLMETGLTLSADQSRAYLLRYQKN